MRYTLVLIVCLAGCGSANLTPEETRILLVMDVCDHFDGCNQDVFTCCPEAVADWPEECLRSAAYSSCDNIGWARKLPVCQDNDGPACIGNMLVSCSGEYLMEICAVCNCVPDCVCVY